MIIEAIQNYLRRTDKSLDEAVLDEMITAMTRATQRQFMESRTTTFYLRPSNLGKCPRQLWYLAHGAEPEPIGPRGLLKFWMGDLAEIAVLSLAKLGGLDIGLNNAPVRHELSEKCPDCHGERCARCFHRGWIHVGFIDGLLYHDGEAFVVECKSMTERGFQQFKRHGWTPSTDIWGRLQQVQMYLRALDMQRAIIVGFNTNTAGLHEQAVLRNDAVYGEDVPRALRAIRLAEPPPRPPWATVSFMPVKKCYKIVDPRCSYCQTKTSCWPGLFQPHLKGKSEWRIPFERLPAGVPVVESQKKARRSTKNNRQEVLS